MMYMAKVAVCSEVATKHINALYRQKVVLLNVKYDGSREVALRH
jgi:hypothetical protein